MRPHALIPACFAFAAMLSTAAPAATSSVYRWIDDTGSVNYANHPPPANARDVTLIDDATNTISSSEKRTREILNTERRDEAHGASSAADSANALLNSAPTASGEPASAPRATITPMQPEAVRDPCLRSADPKCYERNRAHYVPYRGYTPDGAAAAVGGTSGAAAGGTVGGGSPPPKLVPPKASAYALPPGSDKGAPLPATPNLRR